ncbi:sugar transferase [Sorangium sp. So ce119]|uniref:sugar transferase n=1 Tax=Sorangium sp. So ce119 TaxID=3133279 RepID=UPI003F621232
MTIEMTAWDFAMPAPKRGAQRAAARLRRAALVLALRLHVQRPRVRRAVDIVVAAIALVAALPVLGLAAAAIRLTSRGPVFFAQERIGKHGHPFRMFKLRTMRTDAEATKAQLTADAGEDIRFKMRRDPRVTAVGRVFRKYSVDELPQLWNVLIGDMTLVGPRPPIRSEVERYSAYALRRLEMRPGLTCLWQVRGRSDLPFVRQVELDIEYIDRTTLIDNVLVLSRTVLAVLSGRGAY